MINFNTHVFVNNCKLFVNLGIDSKPNDVLFEWKKFYSFIDLCFIYFNLAMNSYAQKFFPEVSFACDFEFTKIVFL